VASAFKRKGDKRWSVAYFDHEGNRQEKASGTSDKRLAERIAAVYIDKELERVRELVDPAAERLTTHLSEQAELRGTGACTFNAAATAWHAFGRWCVRAQTSGVLRRHHPGHQPE